MRRLIGIFLLALGLSAPAVAEPVFAMRTGYSCSQCHANRNGGGGRTAFGSLYTQTVMSERTLSWRERGILLPADPDARFAIGADLRAQLLAVRPDQGDSSSSFEVPEANVYAEVRVLPGKLSLYLDEKIGPSGASTREAFGIWSFPKINAYIKAGKFLPAFGWRLPDDEAFSQRFTGYTYSAPDQGVEFGFEQGRWSMHMAGTNGAGGGSDTDNSKKVIVSVARRLGKGRIGISAARNTAAGVTTRQAALFGGLQFGRLTLLAEGDWSKSESVQVDRTRLIGFFEADLLIRRGLNLKFAHDWIDPDRDIPTDARQRDSLGIEYTPYPFVQLRVFIRSHDGPPPALAGSMFLAGSRDEQAELELHFFF